MPTTTQTITDADCCCTPEDVCSARLTELADAETNLTVDLVCVGACTDCEGCFPDTSVMAYQIPEMGFPHELEWFSESLCNNGLFFQCQGAGLYTLTFPSAIGTVTIPTTVVSVVDSPFVIVFTTSSGWFVNCGPGDEYEITVTIYE